MVGSLQGNAGGGIIADQASLTEIEERVAQDPFVIENIVTVEILEIAPKRVDQRLSFLIEGGIG